ncbi:acyl-CoA thioesterase domain-containing protein [Corynebacterium sp. Q4381]|uniref:acyl-CoA thioesterase n=1 Tax=Corynebacterium sp. Marseille-Q4381 TaxID=3121597 RepID=UPI002FE65B57
MSTSELRRVLGVAADGGDTFRGPAMNTDVFVRTFGGHLAAQALAAASATVEGSKTVHSLHSYFLAGGEADQETLYRVRRLRDGRSFSSRTVEAFQGGTLLYTLTASFHHHADVGPEHAEPFPPVPGPETIPAGGPIPSGVPGAEKDFREWDIRVVPQEEAPAGPKIVSGRCLWFRYREELEVPGAATALDTDAFHACALTYMSDMTLLYSSLQAHPGAQVQLASLDHAIWFFRPVRVTDWLLYQQSSPSASSGRALTQGRLFNAGGDLVALVAQEGLARQLRPGATQVPMRGK